MFVTWKSQSEYTVDSLGSGIRLANISQLISAATTRLKENWSTIALPSFLHQHDRPCTAHQFLIFHCGNPFCSSKQHTSDPFPLKSKFSMKVIFHRITFENTRGRLATAVRLPTVWLQVYMRTMHARIHGVKTAFDRTDEITDPWERQSLLLWSPQIVLVIFDLIECRGLIVLEGHD